MLSFCWNRAQTNTHIYGRSCILHDKNKSEGVTSARVAQWLRSWILMGEKDWCACLWISVQLQGPGVITALRKAGEHISDCYCARLLLRTRQLYESTGNSS